MLDFFAALARPQTRLIYDVVNLWQMGSFPRVAGYRRLAPVIGMLHLKGGRSDRPGGALRWRSHLDDASWPLRPILSACIAERRSPVICLNPPHGADHPDYHWDHQRDLRFLRTNFPEIA